MPQAAMTTTPPPDGGLVPLRREGFCHENATRTHMSPLLIYAMVFIGVTAVIGMFFFIFGDGTGKTGERLDLLTGKKRKDDEATTILKKTALDRDKKSLLEALTPNVPTLQKLITQADANITPSTFMMITAILGALGFTASWLAGVKPYFAPLLGVLLATVPFAW